jgi:two-component system sensor histidine kinase/response regulator
VTDTGIGISPEHGEQLFQSFVQGDTSMTRRYGGTGLGLAISRELVSLMGGAIGFTSEPDVGSTFWFTANLGRKTAVFTDTGSAEPDLELRASGRILLADDNAVNRRIAQAMLLQLGHVVDTVQNGQAALEALQNVAYDLVFMDVQMPELDGFEATRAIRHLRGPAAKVPIIAMTAHAMVGDRERCIEAGMDDYVSKPIKRESLEKVVSLWIQRRDLQRLAAATGATSALEGSVPSHPGRGS